MTQFDLDKFTRRVRTKEGKNIIVSYDAIDDSFARLRNGKWVPANGHQIKLMRTVLLLEGIECQLPTTLPTTSY